MSVKFKIKGLRMYNFGVVKGVSLQQMHYIKDE